MMYTKLLRILSIILLAFSNQLFFAQSAQQENSLNELDSIQSQPNASDSIEIADSVLVNICDSQKSSSPRAQIKHCKQVKVFKLNLNPTAQDLLMIQAKQLINDRVNTFLSVSKPSSNKIDLGMNKVPVLEQGIYGTCTVFVVTAALDALMHSGDYISQQCLLELGVTLQNSYVNSGWNGAWGADILNRVENYGIVSHQNCPHKYADPNSRLSNIEYFNLSNKLWARNFKRNKLPAKSLDSIRAALNKGHRVLISTIFHKDYINGDGIYGYRYGLWSLPENLNKFIREINYGASTGHSTLVVGYNDQTELLKIRNSWGVKAGVKGDYYMTYDYYQLMNIDAIEII